MRYQLLIFAFLGWLGVNTPVPAEELKSPKGFTIGFPDGWMPATEEQLKQEAEAVRKLRGTPSNVAAKILGPRSDNFTPNMDISVFSGNTIPSGKDEAAYLASTKRGLEASGKVYSIKAGHTTVGEAKSFSVSFERVDRTGRVVRQWIVMVPGKGVTYVLACTTLKSQWEGLWKDFDSAVHSFKIDDSKKAEALREKASVRKQ